MVCWFPEGLGLVDTPEPDPFAAEFFDPEPDPELVFVPELREFPDPLVWVPLLREEDPEPLPLPDCPETDCPDFDVEDCWPLFPFPLLPPPGGRAIRAIDIPVIQKNRPNAFMLPSL